MAEPTDKTGAPTTADWEALQARLRAAEERLAAFESGAMQPRNDEFLALLAHEFRNPLAPIRSAVEIMDMIGQRNAALDKARDMIARQVDQLSRLVDDLLDVSRINQGAIDLASEPVEVSAVIAAAAGNMRRLLDERRHDLTLDVAPAAMYVQGDFARLVQVLEHLLENAAKYTDPGGAIRVRASPSDDSVSILVTDTGIGIAPDFLPYVFEVFTQADRSGPYTQGLGVGLSLVRNLVELHGGSIEASSEGPGKGSEFVVRLPLMDVSATEAPFLRTARRDMPRRIVLIDDNEDAAESMAMLLRLKGHEVHVAYDGAAGVSLALDTRPDCVLVDIGLPGIDGYEVAKRLRSRDDGRLLLIALTGYGQSEDRLRSKQAGFDHHLVKPVAQHVLDDLLRGE